jgi:multicomponent Na+:H+ antiporter subunit D
MSIEVAIILPILLPFTIAVISIFFWWKRNMQFILNAIGAAGLLTSTLILFFSVLEYDIITLQIGNWPAPFGITLVCDYFSAIMILATGILGAGAAVYSMVSMDNPRINYGYFPLFYFLMMGIIGAFLAGDIFNLYVWFELVLISSFVLIALGSERAQLEGAIKYVTLNLFASIIFLTAVGMLYGAMGALNMADLALKVANSEHQGILMVISIFFFIAFGIKAAIFPLFFWLPASYHTPPVAVSALFAGLLTKVGVYALIRVFTLIFPKQSQELLPLFLIIAGLTMVVGVLGAAAQFEIRRLLSFHIISQIGYMLMGLAIFTPLSIAAAIFFIFHNIIVKNALFLVSGIIYKIKGHYQLKYLGGFYKNHIFLSVLFIIPALSLAGVPPFSGFWGKLLLIKSGIEAGQYVIVFVSVGVSLITLYSMIKIWNEAFWKIKPEVKLKVTGQFENFTFLHKCALYVPIVWLCIVIFVISFWANKSFEIAGHAGHQLMHPEIYIKAVLGGKP